MNNVLIEQYFKNQCVTVFSPKGQKANNNSINLNNMKNILKGTGKIM